MDKAAQLVAVLVFLVFGFLFGNIFLYVLLSVSLCLSLSLKLADDLLNFPILLFSLLCKTTRDMRYVHTYNIIIKIKIRYSYAQKKYNPPEGRKPKKKIGAKKKKMLALKSGIKQ